MSLKDGKENDIYGHMIENDKDFKDFMDARDHFEGAKIPWYKRYPIDTQIICARQYIFQKKFWRK